MNETNQKWDKNRQEIDQLNANIKKLKAKIDAIRQASEDFPPVYQQKVAEILGASLSPDKSKQGHHQSGEQTST